MTPRSTPFAKFALVAAAAVSLLTAVSAINTARSPWRPGSHEFANPSLELPAGETFSREYDLCEHKAPAMFDLLEPADVSVFVRKSGNRITIEGRAWEVDAIDRLVELVTRRHGQDRATVRRYIDRALEVSGTDVQYRLPRRKREALHRILAFDDVPVLAGELRTGVRVEATREDQETVRAVVDILRGKRNRCGGIRCLLGFHSCRCRTTPIAPVPPTIKIGDQIITLPVPEVPRNRRGR